MIMFMHNAHVHDLAWSCTCERTGKCRFSIPQYEPECICSLFNCSWSCTAPVRVHVQVHVHEDVCAHVLDPVQVHTHVLVRVHVCIYFQDLKRSPTPECVRKTAEPTFSFLFFSLQFLDKIETFLPIKLGRWMSIKSPDLGWSKTGNKISWHCQRVWRSWHDAGQQKRIKNSGKLIGN